MTLATQAPDKSGSQNNHVIVFISFYCCCSTTKNLKTKNMNSEHNLEWSMNISLTRRFHMTSYISAREIRGSGDFLAYMHICNFALGKIKKCELKSVQSLGSTKVHRNYFIMFIDLVTHFLG